MSARPPWRRQTEQEAKATTVSSSTATATNDTSCGDYLRTYHIHSSNTLYDRQGKRLGALSSLGGGDETCMRGAARASLSGQVP